MNHAARTVCARLAGLAALVISAVCVAQTGENAESVPASVTRTDARPTALSETALKPRLELHIPSIQTLITDAQRSHTGVLLAPLLRLASEMASTSTEGVEAEEAGAIIRHIGQWTNTAIGVFTYAPDTEGRPRWAIRFDWPLRDLHDRLRTLLELQTVTELLEEITISPAAGNVHEITLAGSTLAYLAAMDAAHSCLVSHKGLPVPSGPFARPPEMKDDEMPLIVCRLNLTGTEKDSGATFLSSFSAVTDIVYSGRVDDDGDWVEAVLVHWPPISGVGAKALFGRVKQTFFVPGEAFGALAFKAAMGPGMLDAMAGFGQQAVMEAPGQMAIIGEPGIGPITSSVESEMCVTLLPGTGFLPAPDIVVQARTKRAKRLIDRVREEVEQINEAYRERDRSEPWHESTVRGRAVFWSDGAARYPGVVMPLVMRPVLFTTTEIDARENRRDFLVLGWTSTSPERFVRRWLDLPRTKNKRYVPERKKTNGQLWINWRQVYKWFSPYVNVATGALVGMAPFPDADEVADSMTDALLTAKTSYAGLSISHQGPLPAGLLLVPSLVNMSSSTDEGGGSDLARERLACQRLKVLHHHATLFKKDVGRWPAEVAELDGYVDFAGHPGLLKLRPSSRKRWTEWFGEWSGKDKKGDQEEADDEEDELDDDLYIIDWGRDSWRLELAPDTLEHLEELYIDQDGKIHRKEKVEHENEDKISKGEEDGDEPSLVAVFERAARNVERRYLPPRKPSDAEKE